MGGCRCSYKNCPNTTKTKETLQFFHYPVKQKARCTEWIVNAEKPNFYDLDEDQLRNKVVCETHFEACHFSNFERKRLLPTAVPTMDGDSAVAMVLSSTALALPSTSTAEDVQVLPANADRTVFVVETENMPKKSDLDKVESYIYTDTGLVLPINKPPEIGECSMASASRPEPMKTDESSVMEIDGIPIENFEGQIVCVESPEPETLPLRRSSSVRPSRRSIRSSGASIRASSENREVVGGRSGLLRKINQNSKQIASIKRLLKQRSHPRSTTVNSALNLLKTRLPASLFSVVNLTLNFDHRPSLEEMEFFRTLYSVSPQIYRMLNTRFFWKLPHPNLFPSTSGMRSNGESTEGGDSGASPETS